MKKNLSLVKGIAQLIERINILLMGFLAAAVIITVFLRYVFNISFIWAEELIVFTFIATTYFGIILCVKENEHIAIDYFKNLFSPIVKLIIETVIAVIVIITLLYLAYVSLSWIETVGNTLTSGLKIHCRFIYIMMPISFTLSSIFELEKIIRKWIDMSKTSAGRDMKRES